MTKSINGKHRKQGGQASKGRHTGSLLDIAAKEMLILDYAGLPAHKRDALLNGDPVRMCHCPPRQKNRLGGCHPAITWADPEHTALKAICVTCMKALVSGHHRRRDQQHLIGLTKLRLDHVDIADLKAAGLFVEPPTPLERGGLERAMDQFVLERVGGLP